MVNNSNCESLGDLYNCPAATRVRRGKHFQGLKGYVAGPMRGIENYNFPAFDRAENRLTNDWGMEITSPASMDRNAGFDETAAPFGPKQFAEAMRRDLRVITEMDAIVLLPGWENSTGANNELRVARMCGLEIYEYHEDAKGNVQLWRIDDVEPDTFSGQFGSNWGSPA